MSERRSPSPEECKWLFEKLEKQARSAEAERKRIMIRFLCDLLIALLIAGAMYVAWFFILRPAPISGLMSTLSGGICTPSRFRGCGPGPACPPQDFVLPPMELPAWPFAPAQGVE